MGLKKGQKIAVMVQARMSSQRLPGKVMREVKGKPLIGYLLESVQQCRLVDEIILTTSDQREDDLLADYAYRQKVTCFRGALDQVAERMDAAARYYNVDVIVRISGDSPLLDYRLIDQAIEYYLDKDVDLVTNVAKRTFPKGQSVEVFGADLLAKACQEGLSAQESEHVTLRFYKEISDCKIFNFEYDSPLGDMQTSVDTVSEFEFFARMVQKMLQPHWMYDLKSIVNLQKEVNTEK